MVVRTSGAAWAGLCCLVWPIALASAPPAAAQLLPPSTSQVEPPVIRPAPIVAPRIVLPRVEAGATVPEQAKTLSFVLTGVDVADEFDDLAPARRALEAPLIGKRITVAQVFELASALQAAYVRAGYPLVRIVITPQELDKSARVALRVVDGFVERIDAEALPAPARRRVSDVLAPLLRKPRLTQAELERRLLIAGEAPGLVLNAVFAAGQETGGTVLVLTGQWKPLTGSAYVDNAMPVVFGTGQLVLSGSANGNLGLGEQFFVSAAGLPDRDWITANPTRRYLSAGFALPLGIDGLKLDATVTNGITTPRVSGLSVSQGTLDQWRTRLAYDLVKRRDVEITVAARLDGTDEELFSLFFMPPIALSLDRVRAARGGVEGIWRRRESGTVITFGGVYSRGLDALGARTAADAIGGTPLSRLGADAVFDKLDGHIEITQALPSDLYLMLSAAGQTSFNKPLLKSEQFDLVGPRFLSGYAAGSFPGDTAWVTRVELGRNVALPVGPDPLVLTPYLFGATGERILVEATVLEQPSVHATNLGAGLRYALPTGDPTAAVSGFVEFSRQHNDNFYDANQNGWRLFTGALLRY